MTDQPSDAAPAPAEPSASVLAVRQGGRGMEVLMIRRHRDIAFGGGALVFPGGKVDPRDVGPPVLARCAGHEGLAPADRAARIAAIREAFEEAGILLATRDGVGAVPAPERLAELGPLRAALSTGAAGLEALLGPLDLRLDLSVLLPFGHWITPRYLPRRFDTRFYLVAAPDGALELHDGNEAEEAVWLSPAEALAAGEAGTYSLMFPTRMNLVMLGRSASVEEALAATAARPLVTVEPVMGRNAAGEKVLVIPEAAGYGLTEELVSRVMGKPARG
ncbi:MAG: NUDIX domain-containing protein [Alphaproteobacteria bacterium]|nr:NUDIX domain-containing protein [Alphaproteobacteria bacterium]